MDLRTGVAVDCSAQGQKAAHFGTTPSAIQAARTFPVQAVVRTGAEGLCRDCGRLTRVAGIPRWENDRTVRLFGWDDERCPECGARIPET